MGMNDQKLVRACVAINVMKDYPQDRSEAIKLLNKDIQELVDKSEFTVTYNKRRVPIRFPLVLHECGLLEPNLWNTVEIWCSLPCVKKDFDFDLLKIGKCPQWIKEDKNGKAYKWKW